MHDYDLAMQIASRYDLFDYFSVRGQQTDPIRAAIKRCVLMARKIPSTLSK